MPNTNNAKKAHRRNEIRREHNRTQRSALRTVIKKFKAAAAGSDRQAAEAAFLKAVQRLDKAAAKQLIHKNTAARTKSRLSKYLKPAASAQS
jgi:small subunit ribosomal protein S20